MSGGKSESATTTVEPWSAQTPYLKNVFSEAQRQYAGFNPQYYPGSTVAGFTAPQRAGQNYLQNYAHGVQPLINSAQKFSNFAQTDALNPDSNPYIQQAARSAIRPVQESFMNTILPGIRAEYRSGQPFGGTREQLAVGKAADALSRNMLDATTNMYSSSYGQGLSAAANAAAQMPNTLGLGAYPGQLMGQVGGQQQGLDQARMLAAQKRWDFYQNQPYNKLDRYQRAVGGQSFGQTTNEPVASSDFANIMGGASMGYGMLGPAIQGAAFNAIGPATAASSPLWALSGPTGGLLGAGLGALAGGFF